MSTANPTNSGASASGGAAQPTNSGNSTVSASGTNSTSLDIPQTAAVGTLSVTQPPTTATSYYKIAPNQLITFGWNLTDVIATPTSLTCSAICANGNTYPVGPTDGKIPGTATEVVWDIYSYQQNNPTQQLPQASCTLSIWDDRGPTATAQAGYMRPGTVPFALYTPQGYTPLSSGWSCANCNSAFSNTVAQPAFVAVVSTFLIVFLSGFHLIRAVRR